jgi:high-affinity Fe2+/Pb2+ permease
MNGLFGDLLSLIDKFGEEVVVFLIGERGRDKTGTARQVRLATGGLTSGFIIGVLIYLLGLAFGLLTSFVPCCLGPIVLVLFTFVLEAIRGAIDHAADSAKKEAEQTKKDQSEHISR